MIPPEGFPLVSFVSQETVGISIRRIYPWPQGVEHEVYPLGWTTAESTKNSWVCRHISFHPVRIKYIYWMKNHEETFNYVYPCVLPQKSFPKDSEPWNPSAQWVLASQKHASLVNSTATGNGPSIATRTSCIAVSGEVGSGTGASRPATRTWKSWKHWKGASTGQFWRPRRVVMMRWQPWFWLLVRHMRIMDGDFACCWVKYF